VKLYLLFSGAQYYPLGARDLQCTKTSVSEANIAGEALIVPEAYGEYDWYEVVELDTETLQHVRVTRESR
jgi:hypothetical protein